MKNKTKSSTSIKQQVYSKYLTNPSKEQDENIENTDEEFFRLLISQGPSTNIDNGITANSKPPWLDMEKFCMGQRFILDHYFGTVFSQVLSLHFLFAFPGLLQPIIMSGNSNTPFTSFKRYLSTILRMRSWYESDPWDDNGDSRRNLHIVRTLHSKSTNALHDARLTGSTDAQGPAYELKGPLWDEGAHASIRLDADATLIDASDVEQCPLTQVFKAGKKHDVRISQWDMSLTQFCFVSLMVLYPERFGAGGATEEELEAFTHFWRVIGYLLGIEDRFNFCNRDLAGARDRSKRIIREGVLPMMARVDVEWEHMMRCMFEGMSYYIGGMTAEVSLMYVFETIDITTPNYNASVRITQKIIFYLTKFVLCILLRVRFLRNMLNNSFYSTLKKTESASAEWMERHRKIIYPYEMQNQMST